MALTKSQLAEEIAGALEEDGLTIPLRNIKETLNGLAIVAAEQVEKGNDFTIPGVAKLQYRYTPARKKGEAYKKGDAYTDRFTGAEGVREADSPAKKERVRLVAVPTGAVAKLRPGTKPEAQAVFLKSPAGRAVRTNKAK